MNNKMIKGSVAGATGIVLLMGGFGTYALWSDSTALEGTVQSGHMNVSLVNDPGWTDISSAKTEAEWVPTDFMVPGDTVLMTQYFEIESLGKNLALNLEVDTINGEATADDWDNLVVTMKLDGTDLAGDTDRGFSAPNAGDGQHKLEVTFAFPDVEGDTDEDEGVTLGDYAINIEQVRPSNVSP